MPLSIRSSAFEPSGPIPARFTCEGDDVSPPLEWSGAPEGTRSLDLIVDGGEVTATQPSTVLDVLASPPRIVREGAIPRNVIEQLFA